MERLVSALVLQGHGDLIVRRLFFVSGLLLPLHLRRQPVRTTVEEQLVPLNLEHDVKRRNEGFPFALFADAMKELQRIGAVAQ